MNKVSRFQQGWTKYGQKVILFFIVILTATIGFKLGQIDSKNDTKVEVSIRDIKDSNPAQEEARTAIDALKRQGVDIHKEDTKTEKILAKDCLFIASRNSKKYHTLDCKYGKKIKTTNLICFKNAADAKSRGYIPAKGCLGNK